MTEQQLEVRQRRAQEAPMVIQRTAEGFLVYSAASPSKAYHVTTQEGRLVCACPDFQNNNEDPEWCCKHILAVLDKYSEAVQTKPQETQTEEAEERAAIQAEAAPPLKQRVRRTPVNGTGRATLGPSPNASPKRNGNGNGAAQMLIKRSVSPDGRIDAVSIEFSTPVSGTPVAQIKAQALRTLKLQNEIAGAFLNQNGDGKTNPRFQPRKSETKPPPSAPANGEAVPACLLDVGTSNGRYGPRLFISVQASGKRYHLYGSASLQLMSAMPGRQFNPASSNGASSSTSRAAWC
ncbi:MAG: SWIM zinc finger domain-containing protein [Acidobacteria bacterium]|nr:SWIM zinc finger domain-containing protein [Acidobacteriota bacterium]